MKLNRNELHCMIDQIDEELLKEAEEGYQAHHLGRLQRILPATGCIILLVGITASLMVKGKLNTVVQETTEETSYQVLSERAENSLVYENNSLDVAGTLNSVTDMLEETGSAEGYMIDYLKIKIDSHNKTISYGTIELIDAEHQKEVEVNILENYITADLADSVSDTELDLTSTSWTQFCAMADSISTFCDNFTEHTYMEVSQLVLGSIQPIPENCIYYVFNQDSGSMEEIEETVFEEYVKENEVWGFLLRGYPVSTENYFHQQVILITEMN